MYVCVFVHVLEHQLYEKKKGRKKGWKEGGKEGKTQTLMNPFKTLLEVVLPGRNTDGLLLTAHRPVKYPEMLKEDPRTGLTSH